MKTQTRHIHATHFGSATLLRFFKFKEILKNCSAECVKKLSAFEKNRLEPHRAARKRLYEAIEAEEASEAENEAPLSEVD